MTLPARLVPVAPRSQGPAFQLPPIRRGAVVVVSLITALVWSPSMILIGVAAGVRIIVRRLRQRNVQQQRIAQAEREVPVVVALTQLALAAGHGPRRAVGVVGSYGQGVLGSVFVEVSRRLDAGADFGDAIDAVVEGGIGAATTLRLLEQAERLGQPLDTQLAILADDAQRRRLADIDEQSQRLSVKMLFPLVFCVLPAFLLLSMVPLIVTLLDGIAV